MHFVESGIWYQESSIALAYDSLRRSLLLVKCRVCTYGHLAVGTHCFHIPRMESQVGIHTHPTFMQLLRFQTSNPPSYSATALASESSLLNNYQTYLSSRKKNKLVKTYKAKINGVGRFWIFSRSLIYSICYLCLFDQISWQKLLNEERFYFWLVS